METSSLSISSEDNFQKLSQKTIATNHQRYTQNDGGIHGKLDFEKLPEQPSNDDLRQSSIIVLFVIRMVSQAKRQSAFPSSNGEETRKYPKLDHFKMQLDCSKCLTNGDDSSLRRFRRKVLEKLKVGDNFKIYNSQGHIIEESDLYFLNHDANLQAAVYVSNQNDSFDYETYIKLFRGIMKLGEGGYGLVQLGRHIITNQEYAIKFIMPTGLKADEVGKAFKEAQLLQNISHPNIVQLFNVFQLSDSKIVLMMQYIQGGTLKEYIESKNGKVTEDEAQKIMITVGKAINYCHKKDIVHRDIKMENILLNEKSNLDKGLQIIDFGIAGLTQLKLEEHKAGTLKYCPPELLSGQSFKAEASFDIWSLGVLLYRLVFGEFPYEAPTWKDTKNLIIQANLKFPKELENHVKVSDTCKALIKVMLNKDANLRPKLFQLIKHPWFIQSQSQISLMNTTMFQQNTMMNFFRQELNHLNTMEEIEQHNGSNLSPIESRKSQRHAKFNQQNLLKTDKGKKYLVRSNQKHNRELKNTLNKHKSPYSFPANDFINIKTVVGEDKSPKGIVNLEIRGSLDVKKEKLNNLRNFRLKNTDDSIKKRNLFQTIDKSRNELGYERSLHHIRPSENLLAKTPMKVLPQISNKKPELPREKYLYHRVESTRHKSNQTTLTKAPSVSSFRSMNLQYNHVISPHNKYIQESARQQNSTLVQLQAIPIDCALFEEIYAGKTEKKSKVIDISEGFITKIPKRQFSILTGQGTTQATMHPDDQSSNLDRTTTNKHRKTIDSNVQLLNDLNQKIINMNQQLDENKQMIFHQKQQLLQSNSSNVKRKSKQTSFIYKDSQQLIGFNFNSSSKKQLNKQ